MTQIDPNTLDIHNTAQLFDAFQDAGYDLYFVGGCVRNAIMGVATTDIDLATDAHPANVRKIAQNLGLNVISTGEAHGTLTVMIAGTAYEITTFRQDVSTDGRRATVAFSGSIQEDAERRDFTMNALYATKTGDIIDPLGGLQDARDRRLRFIGNPADRINEDFLRILRFFRFYAWYCDPALGIDPEGYAACAQYSHGLESVSRERIGAELVKLLSAPDPAPAMASLQAAGILSQILPGALVDQLAILTEFESNIDPSPWRRLALLGGDDIQKHLRLSNAQSTQVANIASYARETESAFSMGYYLGETVGWDAWLVRCTLLETPPQSGDYEQVKCGATAEFPLTAADLMPQFSGRAIGETLRAAETHWLANGAQGTRDDLLKFLNFR